MKQSATQQCSDYTDSAPSVFCFILLCLLGGYILSLPLAIRGSGGSIPEPYLPAARLLTTPLHDPLAWYLKLWGVEPAYVECEVY